MKLVRLIGDATRRNRPSFPPHHRAVGKLEPHGGWSSRSTCHVILSVFWMNSFLSSTIQERRQWRNHSCGMILNRLGMARPNGKDL